MSRSNIDGTVSIERSMASSPEQNESVSTSDVWSMLPKDIAMRVLARLSVPQLFRARTVCKQWNLLTSSPEFLNLFSGQSHEPYFPIMTSRSFMARCPDQQYNPEQAVNSLFNGFFGCNHTTETWQRLPPLDFLPRQGLMLVAAAEGILCFQGNSTLFLCNPVARTCIELPQFAPNWSLLRTCSVNILVDHLTKSYRVVVVGNVRSGSL